MDDLAFVKTVNCAYNVRAAAASLERSMAELSNEKCPSYSRSSTPLLKSLIEKVIFQSFSHSINPPQTVILSSVVSVLSC